MSFSSVTLYNFRNLQDSELKFLSKNVYLVGENGQGKTNFLEALYLLSLGSSFRIKTESLLIKNGFKEMSVGGIFNKDGITDSLSLKIQNSKKSIFINKKRLTDRKQLLKDYPCIAFTHDDINFVNGSPAYRRQFINQTISLYDFSYIDALKTYNRVIKLRNKSLKERKTDLLDIYDGQAAEAGLEIQNKRIKLLNEFNTEFSRLYAKVSGTDVNLQIRYFPSWKLTDKADPHEAEAIFKSTRERDMVYGTTTTGPHRDRIGFFSGKTNFSSTASTGQIRLISLVLRTAQASFAASVTGKNPVLLLDDVLLEMDLKKRERFLENLPEYDQAFFTFLPDASLVKNKESKTVYLVSNGRITKKDEL